MSTQPSSQPSSQPSNPSSQPIYNQFEKSYSVTANSILDHHLWNNVFRNIDTRLIGVEVKKASFEVAEQQLLELGLRRINETITPAAERIVQLSELGFLTAASEEMLLPIDGQNLSVHLIKGVKAELFTPSPFVALVRRSTPEGYAIGRLLAYDREAARVDMQITSVQGISAPCDDFDVCALAGSVKAMWDALQQSRQIRDEVTTRHVDIQTQASDVTAKHTQVQAAHTDFVSTWYGVRSTPPDDAKIGAMYLDIAQNPARVMVKAPSGWSIAALAADDVYTKVEADGKFLTTANAQFLPLSGGTVTGDVHVNGSFYTPNLAQVGAAGYYNNGNIYGSIWADWHISGFLKEAVDARIEKRAAEWSQAKLNWAVVDTRVVGWVTPQDAQLPSGYFCVGGNYKPGGGGNENNTTSAKVTFYGRQPQVNIPVIGWRQMGYW